MKSHKRYLSIICFTVLMVSVISIILTKNTIVSADEFTPEDNIEALSSGKDDYNPVQITSDNSTDFTNVDYIDNANYFKINPQHKKNNTDDNSRGVCTTVAVQLLIGYHNYYSDRRIIPEFNEDGQRFLCEGYGNIGYNPKIYSTFKSGQGLDRIGTEDTVYQAIYDLTPLASFPALGQSVGNVTNGANKFLDKYTPANIRNTINLTSGSYNKAEVMAELNNGNPVVVCFVPKIDFWHVVPIYGYANYKGEFGYIVHFGWGARNTHVWIQEKYCQYTIKMTVNHTHEYEDTGNDVKSIYRELRCKTCGCNKVDDLYQTNAAGNTITGVNYPLHGDICLPTELNGKTITAIGERAFCEENFNFLFIPNAITEIGEYAFYKSKINEIEIPRSVQSIGKNAFANNTVLTDITFGFRSQLKTIGESAFAYTTNLSTVELAGCNQLESIGERAFYRSGIKNITLPEGLMVIRNEAFSCSKLEAIKLPKSIRNIWKGTFSYTTNLKNVELSPETNTIETQAFYDSRIEEINLPASVVGVFDTAFLSCRKLVNINVDAGNANLTSVDGVLYNKNKTKLICYPCGKSDLKPVISEETNEIGNFAFAYSDKITQITLPCNVTTIGDSSFAYCYGIKKVYIENITNILNIQVFSNGITEGLTIYVPDSLYSQYVAKYPNYNFVKSSEKAASESIVATGESASDETVPLGEPFILPDDRREYYSA